MQRGSQQKNDHGIHSALQTTKQFIESIVDNVHVHQATKLRTEKVRNIIIISKSEEGYDPRKN